MFGFRRSPSPANDKIPKQNSVDPGFPSASSSNPFDSDTESDKKQTIRPARRTSSELALITPNKSNPFDDDDDDDGWGRGPSLSSRTRNVHNRNPGDQRDFDSMSVQELEGYAVNRAEDTTKSVNNSLKIAEEIRQDATRTLDTLHHQGEQIIMTHMTAVDLDRNLSRGEKLLNNLGGMFSKPWKPKKTREITGPTMLKDDNNRKQPSSDQREKLGLAPALRGGRAASRTPPPEPTNTLQKVEMEKAKQDDVLSDLSNILGDLKGMASEMGSELDRQNKALNHVSDDVDELNSRMKGANQRARRLIGK